MGIETLLILFGIIGQAATREGERLHEVAETCLIIGVVVLTIQILFLLFAWMFSSR